MDCRIAAVHPVRFHCVHGAGSSVVRLSVLDSLKMNLKLIIEDVQRALGVGVDGNPGPETWSAIHRRLVPASPPAQAATATRNSGLVDERSERNIITLHPRVQPYARALVNAASAQGITIKVLSGHRTYEEQDALYRQAQDGKDNDGDGRTDEADERVTRAPAGYSNHNFALAFDIGVFTGNRYLEASPLYKAIGAIGKGLGLEWGGNWKSIVDEPHFQLRPEWASGLSESQMLAGFRSRVAAGKDVFSA